MNWKPPWPWSYSTSSATATISGGTAESSDTARRVRWAPVGHEEQDQRARNGASSDDGQHVVVQHRPVRQNLERQEDQQQQAEGDGVQRVLGPAGLGPPDAAGDDPGQPGQRS